MDYKPDINLKTTFNTVAEKYEKGRLGYPDELFEKLIEVAGIDVESSKLLEIGPGPGKATKSLAKKGFDIVGVEPGEALADLARKILVDYPKVKIETTTFEQFQQDPSSIDLIFAANAFHWVAPEIRWKKTHDLLKTHGYLALISNSRISDEKGDVYYHLFEDVLKKYFGPDYMKLFGNNPLSKVSDLKPSDEYDKDLFELAYFGCFTEKIKFTTDMAIQMMDTVSHVIALDKEVRERFFGELRAIIDEKMGGIAESTNGNILHVFRAK